MYTRVRFTYFLLLFQEKTMLVTIEEAKTKWCPAARTRVTVADQEVTVNRLYDAATCTSKVLPSTLCLADACMAWCLVPGSSKGYCGLADK